MNPAGPVEKVIREKLNSALCPNVLEIKNESTQHGLPLEAEQHFHLTIVSASFADRSRIERHRLVHTVLADELAGQIHAVTVQAFTPEEWRARAGAVLASPACLGGGKRERE